MEKNKLIFKAVIESNSIAVLANMAREIWEEHYTPIIGKDQVAYMVEKFQSTTAITNQIHDSYQYYTVCAIDNIGYLSFKQQKDKTLFLSKIYLMKKYRGLGYGRQMMQFVLHQAQNLNCSSIVLTVNKYNTIAIQAYLKLGFIQRKDLVIDIGCGFVMDDFEMVYQLPQGE